MPDRLDKLLNYARVAPGRERARYVARIARFGAAAIEAVEPWLADASLRDFGTQIIVAASHVDNRKAAITALRSAHPSSARAREELGRQLTMLGYPELFAARGALDDAVDAVRSASARQQAALTTEIARFGAAAVDQMESWLQEPELRHLAVRVIEMAGRFESRGSAVAALQGALKDVPALSGDIEPALARLGVARRAGRALKDAAIVARPATEEERLWESLIAGATGPRRRGRLDQVVHRAAEADFRRRSLAIAALGAHLAERGYDRVRLGMRRERIDLVALLGGVIPGSAVPAVGSANTQNVWGLPEADGDLGIDVIAWRKDDSGQERRLVFAFVEGLPPGKTVTKQLDELVVRALGRLVLVLGPERADLGYMLVLGAGLAGSLFRTVPPDGPVLARGDITIYEIRADGVLTQWWPQGTDSTSQPPDSS